MRRIASLLAAAVAAAPALLSSSAPADPFVPWSVDAPFVRDAAGRVRLFHGVNAVWKRDPYYPPSALYGEPLATSYFDERDAEFLAANGLNTVRLGVIWAGAEPQHDVFDAAYLDRIEDIVDALAARGVTVMLDFHQDLYNERYQGEGFPDWATIDDGIPASRCCGFPGNYFVDPATHHAFNNLWLNREVAPGHPLWDEFREFWVHVAGRFKDKANVVGYDLLNEPFMGSQWPSCANTQGCPAFDVGFLQPFSEHAIAGIRTVDQTGIVWWEPNVSNDFGTANNVGLLSPIADAGGQNGISFHDYCLFGGASPFLSRGDDPECAFAEDLTMQRQHEASARNDSALFLTEFGASDDLVDIARVTALADRYMVSWHYWHYGRWFDPTGNPVEEGMFGDDLVRPGSLKQEKADLLIRTYPQAVAGTPEAFSFDPVTKRFVLDYIADASITAPTQIFVPVARHYPGGYVVEVNGRAAVTSAPSAPLLTLVNTGDGLVSVTLSAT